MGMSSDYEEAVQIGATHVRVGARFSAIVITLKRSRVCGGQNRVM